jgi:hypothetical protein
VERTSIATMLRAYHFGTQDQSAIISGTFFKVDLKQHQTYLACNSNTEVILQSARRRIVSAVHAVNAMQKRQINSMPLG